jgi:hypothetical protein
MLRASLWMFGMTAAGLGSLALAGACGDDEKDAAAATCGTAGHAPQGSGGAGAGGGGTGGAVDDCGGTDCGACQQTTCARSACKVEYDLCQQNPECKDLLACIGACFADANPPQCDQACHQSHPGGENDLGFLLGCFVCNKKACYTACDGAVACMGGPGPGGAPPMGGAPPAGGGGAGG